MIVIKIDYSKSKVVLFYVPQFLEGYIAKFYVEPDETAVTCARNDMITWKG